VTERQGEPKPTATRDTGRASPDSVSGLQGAAQTLPGVPRRIVRSLLLAALDHLRKHPRRKEQVRRILAHSGRVGVRLREFARRRFDPTQVAMSTDLDMPKASGRARNAGIAASSTAVAERLAIERRMAYMVELENQLDAQAARHRSEVESLHREIDRLRALASRT